jgi:hypothetical protein
MSDGPDQHTVPAPACRFTVTFPRGGLAASLALVALGLLFAAPAQAHSDRLPAMARMAGADQPPTPAQDRHARAIARMYWGGTPNCGEPSVRLVALNPAYAGFAWLADCRIEIQSRHDWAADPVRYCDLIVHENGHLVLGPGYFAALNPADPAHAPRGYTAFGMGIMDQSNQRTSACDAMVAPPAAKPRARPTRRQRHHR